MNKLAVAVAALLAVLSLGVPPALGTLTEARVRGRVAELNNSGVVSAEVKSYDRGWFGSSAKIEIGLTPAYRARLAPDNALAPGALDQRTMIVVDFAHGPIAVLDGVHFGWSRMVAHLDPAIPGLADLEQQLGVPYLFEFRGRTAFSGVLRFDAEVPPIEVPIGGAQLKFAGAFIEGSFARAELVSSAHIDSVEFSSPAGSFSLSKLQATVDNELRSRYVMPGKAQFSIDRIAIVDALRGTTPQFEVSRLHAASDMALDPTGALLDMQTTYELDRLRVGDSEVTAATVGLALHNLDVEAIEAYSVAARELAVSGGTSGPRGLLASLAPQIERALAAAPSLTLQPIRFQLDGEALDGHLDVLTNTARLPPAGLLNLENPLLMAGLFNSNAELTLTKPLARRIATLAAKMQLADANMPPDQLDYMAEAQSGLLLVTLVGQGVLIEDGDNYHASVRLSDGALTLNGNPLPFSLP